MTQLGTKVPDAARRQALSEAADWFAEQQAETFSSVQQQRFRAWLAASDTHRWAWQQIEAVSRRMEGGLDTAGRRRAPDVIGQARSGRQERRRWLSGMLGLGAMAVMLAWLWPATPMAQWVARFGADYHTSTGEVSEIVLADGTRVWLNSASALDVTFDADRRRLKLVSGEVLIKTGQDDTRPLWVDTRDARLTPLGTRFSVRQRGETAQLAVFEGAVSLELHDAGVPPRTVPAGRQAAYSARTIEPLAPADQARKAWSHGMLLAEDMPLAHFVAQLGEHHHMIVQLDPAIADLTLLGAYPLHDLERTLGMVEAALPVRVRRPLPGWVRLEPARPAQD